MFGLEKIGINFGIGDLMAIAQDPSKGFSLVQKVVDKLFSSDVEEAEQLAKQFLPQLLPDYDATFDMDDLDGREVCITLRKKQKALPQTHGELTLVTA